MLLLKIISVQITQHSASSNFTTQKYVIALNLNNQLNLKDLYLFTLFYISYLYNFFLYNYVLIISIRCHLIAKLVRKLNILIETLPYIVYY